MGELQPSDRSLLASRWTRVERQRLITTEVSVVGGFRFGWVGWLFGAYTNPQLTVSLLLEFRSALQGLAGLVEGDDAPGAG